MKKILEGVKFGNREKQVVMDSSNDFNVGIEYEMNFFSNVDLGELSSDGFATLRDRLNDLYRDELFEDIYEYALNNSVELGLLSNDNNATKLQELIYKIYDIDTDAKAKIPSDDDREAIDATDDMFGGKDDQALYTKMFYDNFDDEELSKFVELVGELQSNNITVISELIEVIDLYFEGEFLGGKQRTAELYGDYIKILGKIITSSDEEKHIMAFYDSMANVELPAPASEESLNYTLGTLDASALPLSDYLEFMDDNYSVELIEEIVTDTASTYEVEDFTDSENYSIPEIDDLESHGVNTEHIYDIVAEHDEQAEIISTKMNVKDAFENIDQMFGFISNHGETQPMAGMHVSISTNKYKHSDFNMMKFVTLLDLPHILDMFPERRFVADLQNIIADTLRHVMNGNVKANYTSNNGKLSSVDIIKEGILDVEADIEDEKYQSIKFGDYHMLNGRIELRFFGGEDYHQLEDEVKHHILRALYLLNFAYTDEYNKVYHKKMAKLVSSVCKHQYGAPLSTLVSVINRYNTTHTKKIDEMYVEYLGRTTDEPNDEMKSFIRNMTKHFGDEWEYNLEFLGEIR